MKQTFPPRRPFLSLVYALLIFLVLAAVLEGTARSPWAAARLPRYRSVGNYHYPFEIKWFGLKRYVARQGSLDILIMGNSMANTGVDPQIIASIYAERTGQTVRAYNFGVEGLTLHANLELAGILLEEYRPRLLVYIADVRDLDDSNSPSTERRFLSDPWLRYRLGDWNLEGWLFDHSQALQMYLPYRNWVRADFPDTFYAYLDRSTTISETGYEADTNVTVFDDDALAAIRQSPECTVYYPAIAIGEARLAELRAFIALGAARGARVFIAEMPVNPIVYECMTGAVDHAAFQRVMDETVTAAGGVFLPVRSEIPAMDHIDMHHLNQEGAAIFSQQLALALLEADAFSGQP
jgi:hypothetical protein